MLVVPLGARRFAVLAVAELLALFAPIFAPKLPRFSRVAAVAPFAVDKFWLVVVPLLGRLTPASLTGFTGLPLELSTPAFADRAAVPAPTIPAAVVPCVPRGAGVPLSAPPRLVALLPFIVAPLFTVPSATVPLVLLVNVPLVVGNPLLVDPSGTLAPLIRFPLTVGSPLLVVPLAAPFKVVPLTFEFIPPLADPTAVPTPVVPEALVPPVPGGALILSSELPVALLIPAFADRAAVPTPTVPEALVPCVPSGAGVPFAALPSVVPPTAAPFEVEVSIGLLLGSALG